MDGYPYRKRKLTLVRLLKMYTELPEVLIQCVVEDTLNLEDIEFLNIKMDECINEFLERINIVREDYREAMMKQDLLRVYLDDEHLDRLPPGLSPIAFEVSIGMPTLKREADWLTGTYNFLMSRVNAEVESFYEWKDEVQENMTISRQVRGRVKLNLSTRFSRLYKNYNTIKGSVHYALPMEHFNNNYMNVLSKLKYYEMKEWQERKIANARTLKELVFPECIV